MATSKNHFKGVNAAKPNERGVYFEPGKYKVKVSKCQVITSRDGKDLFIADLDVLESNNPKHPVGAKRNWCQNIRVDGAQSALQEFVVATLGYDYSTDREKIEKEIAPHCEELLEAACEGKGDDLIGQDVNLEVVLIQTKAKKDFHRHRWFPAAA